MSTLGSGSLSPAAGASVAPEGEGHWAPHGVVLTACVVVINVLAILVIFGFFWRFFSGRSGGTPSASAGVDDEDDDSLPVASPWASHYRHEGNGAQSTPVEDVVSSLPVSVYSSAVAGAKEGGRKAPECAVCIVELRDGDSVRVLPRCGHQFHADCVGAWLRLHTTCPLCRGRVVAPAAAAVADASRNAKDDDVAAECPV